MEEGQRHGFRPGVGRRRFEANRDIDAFRSVGSLLEKDGRGGGGVWEGNLADVDRDGEALAGEDAVHDRDILVGDVGGRGDGEEKDARLESSIS